MSNRYTNMLPQTVEDTREAVTALHEFAEALEQYAGQNMDVEVPVSGHPEGGPENVAEVQMSVYVPKTDYMNIVLEFDLIHKSGPRLARSNRLNDEIFS